MKADGRQLFTQTFRCEDESQSLRVVWERGLKAAATSPLAGLPIFATDEEIGWQLGIDWNGGMYRVRGDLLGSRPFAGWEFASGGEG
jgi:hypothetical protein